MASRVPPLEALSAAPMNPEATEQKGKVESFVTPGRLSGRGKKKTRAVKELGHGSHDSADKRKRNLSSEGQWEKAGDAFLPDGHA